ncbi:acyl-CoA reductase [Sphingobacterium pedocola]|uniref:Acyl-CoA reductase n=1 Tax=Sphingobacterium pedocola TaxID=2082722 RepID=A0ABR9T665_9SPHI|nr:acyl-CoA reductase [Sphingobacterium pedocola]MBE8720414.1 acyl-CoA reductase [Sphingobacterium pedocola]
MTKKLRVQALCKLGDWMLNLDESSLQSIQQVHYKNPWYTEEYVLKQFQSLGQQLAEEKLNKWLLAYPDINSSKRVGLILAGNLPLVGFHDILSVLISGFVAQIKVSSDDAGLTSMVLDRLTQIEPLFVDKIDLVDKLSGYDLIIATGSNNSARYFEYYFSSKPNIIRKNRNSIALLTGEEREEDLRKVGYDIFDYFGLGCRSVSKIFIPSGYPISTFFEAIEHFHPSKEHFKYNNNYDYNKSIYLINGEKHFDNGFLLLKEDKNIASPLAVVFYEEYDHVNDAVAIINNSKERVQCVVTEGTFELEVPVFPLGSSQCPALDDYADGVNTLDFLFANQ